MNERQSDFEWLQQFARAGNQSAFRELVRRHIDLVFATALRKVGDTGAAEEISQNVFGVLARKTWQFAPDDSLPAWLHKTTLLESQSWLRGELRRRRREQVAAELGTTMKTPDESPAFHALVPLLDEALLSLREKDRTALLLRFYESQSLRDVGAALNVSDDTAQKRVNTALEKLAQFFQRRGFKTATVAATTAALQHTASSATAATVSVVINSALQAAPPALAGLAALFARFASLTKLQTAAVCVAIAAGPVAWQINAQHKAQVALTQAKINLAAAQNEFSVVQIERQQLLEAAEAADAKLIEARDAVMRSADTAKKFGAWKERTRARLLAADYSWPEDLPFVRVPKKMLPQLQVRQPVARPGTIKQEARELLGLTPAERAQGEAALQKYFAAMDNLMEANRYETNQSQLVSMSLGIPKHPLASQIWGLTALGDQVKQPANELRATLESVLGSERWPMIAEQLKSFNTDGLGSILALNAGESRQELAIWIETRNGELVASYSRGVKDSVSGDSIYGNSGLLLNLFLPDQEFPINGASAADYMNFQQLPVALTGSAMKWLQEQAVMRLGKKGDR